MARLKPLTNQLGLLDEPLLSKGKGAMGTQDVPSLSLLFHAVASLQVAVRSHCLGGTLQRQVGVHLQGCRAALLRRSKFLKIGMGWANGSHRRPPPGPSPAAGHPCLAGQQLVATLDSDFETPAEQLHEAHL